jgi:hypothetical protein
MTYQAKLKSLLTLACACLVIAGCKRDSPPESIEKRAGIGLLSTGQLKYWCDSHGGLYSPPGVGGAYYCILPDGTLVACDGIAESGCTVDWGRAPRKPDWVHRDTLTLLNP